MSWDKGDIILDSGCKMWSPEFGHLNILFVYGSIDELNSNSIKSKLYFKDGYIFEEKPYGILTLTFEDGDTVELLCENDLSLWKMSDSVAIASNMVDYEETFFYRNDGKIETPYRYRVRNGDGDYSFIGNVQNLYWLDLHLDLMRDPLDNIDDDIIGDILKLDALKDTNASEVGTYCLSYSHLNYWKNNSKGKFIGEYEGYGNFENNTRTIGGDGIDKHLFVADAPCWK